MITNILLKVLIQMFVAKLKKKEQILMITFFVIANENAQTVKTVDFLLFQFKFFLIVIHNF